MRERCLAGSVIALLATHPAKVFASAAAWTAHLALLGIGRLAVTPDPVRIATEGALWGAIRRHGLLAGTVIVSDDAGQFRIGEHALCGCTPNGSCTSWCRQHRSRGGPSR